MSPPEGTDVLRHEYRVLTEEEKAQMATVKVKAQALYEYVESLGVSRETSLAKTKIEEAVMWAIKGLTK